MARHVFLALLAVVLPTAAPAQEVITGPAVLPSQEANWQYSGIEFLAVQNSVLQSFTFNNQGKANTVLLTDSAGHVLDSVAVPAATPIDTVLVNWNLSEGQTYLLFRTTSSNSLFADWNQPLPGNDDITLLNSGFFSGTFAALGGFPDNLYWSSFTNITTLTAVPEPATWAVMLLGLAATGWAVRRHLRATVQERATICP